MLLCSRYSFCELHVMVVRDPSLGGTEGQRDRRKDVEREGEGVCLETCTSQLGFI
jgi:hypothetical protein